MTNFTSADLESTIAQAIAECEQSVLETKLRDDPLRLPFVALASFLRAQRTLYADYLSASRQPISDDVVRQAVTRGFSMHGPAVAREMGRRNLLLAAGIGFTLLLSGAGIGYWARGAVPALVGVAAGAEQCQDRADGSQLCYIPVFRRLPTAK